MFRIESKKNRICITTITFCISTISLRNCVLDQNTQNQYMVALDRKKVKFLYKNESLE